MITALLCLALLQDRPDLDEARRGTDAAIEKQRAHLKEKPADLDARLDIARLHGRLARLLADSADGDAAAALVKESEERFAAGEAELESMAADLNKVDPLNDEQLWQLRNASLSLAGMLVDHSRTPGPAPAQRKAQLERAISITVEILWQTQPGFLWLRANVIAGLAETDLGRFAEAEKSLAEASVNFLKLAAREKYSPSEDERALVEEAFAAAAELSNRRGKPGETVALVDRILKDVKPLSARGRGLLLLRKAEALYLLQDAAGAVALADEARGLDASLAALANRRIVQWSGQGGLRIPADTLMASAETSYGAGRVKEALGTLRRTLEALATPEERARIEPRACYWMGLCFRDLDRNAEALANFERVVAEHPKHELAPSACSEAILCAGREAALTGSRPDLDRRSKLLNLLTTAYPTSPEAVDVAFYAGDDAEDRGEIARAAEIYLGVPPKARKYDDALVAAGRCLASVAIETWKAGAKDAAARTAGQAGLARASEVLGRAIDRLAGPAPKDPVAARKRRLLTHSAYSIAATIAIHAPADRPKEGLQLLERWSQAMPPDDPMQGRRLALEIDARLALDELAGAVSALDALLDRFPDRVEVPDAAKRVADRLDASASERLKTGADVEGARGDLLKVSSYYGKWFKDCLDRGMKIPADKALDVAIRLYVGAREINGIEAGIETAADLAGRRVLQPRPFAEASLVLAALADPRRFDLPAAQRVAVMIRHARCEAFKAFDAADFGLAREAYESTLKAFKALDDKDHLVDAAAEAQPELVDAYIELGRVHVELARLDPKANGHQYGRALEIFGDAIGRVTPLKQRWWTLRFASLELLLERGGPRDMTNAKAGLSSLEHSSPDFDGGTYGMKERFEELKKRLK